MFDIMPRLLFKKRKLVTTMHEFIRLINLHNGKTNLYTSLYKFNNILPKIDYSSVEVDKIYFDLDNGKSHENMKKLYKYANKNRYQYAVFFSGRGYHFYFLVKPTSKLRYPKEALRQSQIKIAEDCGLTIGQCEHADIDAHVVGDTSRMTRIPNTYNIRRGRYCIPLSKKQIETLSHKEIEKLALKQNYINNNIYGKIYFPIDKYDTIKQNYYYQYVIKDTSSSSYNTTHIFKNIPPCINKIIKQKTLGYNERAIVILYMRDKGYSKLETIKFLKEHLTKKKFIH